jgi:DNA-directed RNA polymerase
LKVHADPLRAEQAALESEVFAASGVIYHDRVKRLRESGIEGVTRPMQRIMTTLVRPIGQWIRDWCLKARRAPGRGVPALPYLEAVTDPDVLASLTLRVMLDQATKERRYQSMAVKIGGLVQDELRFEAFAISHPALYDTLDRYIERRKVVDVRHDYRREVLLHSCEKYQVVWNEWPTAIMLQVGSVMIEAVTSNCDLFEVAHRKGKLRDCALVVRATQALLDWLQREHSILAALAPIKMPMVCEPEPHTRYKGGGYLTAPMQKPVVRMHGKDREAFTSEHMPVPFAALNTLQRVPWKVNEWTFNVIMDLWERGRDIPGACVRSDSPPPPAPDVPRESSEYRQWKAITSEAFDRKIAETGRRLATSQILATARKYLGRAIYFPWFFDFRGRLYPSPKYLDPQGADLGKGLLLFANGVPITERGIRWLRIHVANCFGVDKVDFDSRVAWAITHERDIHAVADDPLSNSWWHDADSPVQALSACRELSQALRAGPGCHVSHLPVMVDGSCNGIQILSLLSRDADAGARVNLLPADKPADLYTDVRDVTERLCRESDHEYAALWLEYGITRALVKRPSMIVAYNGTVSAFRAYVEKEVKERTRKGIQHPFGRYKHKACMFLATLIWRAVDEIIDGPRKIQRWTREVASIMSEAGQPIRWTSPSGFRVTQAYPKYNRTRVCTRVGGARARLIILDPTDKLDRPKQRQSLSPNWVHSHDAAIVHLFVTRMAEQGFTDVVTNHDCFGTHAEHMDVLSSAIRETIYETHSHDWLNQFKTELEQASGLTLPDVPERGTLDISKVLESKYIVA